MGAPDSLVRHRCANGRLQWLVLIASRWADGTPDSEQHSLVRTGQSGALSGVPLKFDFQTMRSRVSEGERPSPGQPGPT
jgi:hypothetical protein